MGLQRIGHDWVCTWEYVQGLEQWDPILQLWEVVEFNKSSWKEKKKLELHMVNSGSRAWMVPLESHCHSSSVVLIWLILDQFINSWGGKKVYKKLKSFTSNSSWRTGCMVLRGKSTHCLIVFLIVLYIDDNKIILACQLSWLVDINKHFPTRNFFICYIF